MNRGRNRTASVKNNLKKFYPNDKYEKKSEIIQNLTHTGNGIELNLNRLDYDDTLNGVIVNDFIIEYFDENNKLIGESSSDLNININSIIEELDNNLINTDKEQTKDIILLDTHNVEEIMYIILL